MHRNKPLDALIVLGLGNPGARFEGSRHNVGYRVLDIVIQESRVEFRRRLFSSIYSADLILPGAERRLTALRWAGYMNHSGAVVPYLKRRHRLEPKNLVVVVDNMDLSPGVCRLKMGGGDAGHNGLKSLMAGWGTGRFPRLYIGVGRPRPGVSVLDHVLGVPDCPDALAVEGACRRASDAVRDLAVRDIARVAETLNRRDP